MIKTFEEFIEEDDKYKGISSQHTFECVCTSCSKAFTIEKREGYYNTLKKHKVLICHDCFDELHKDDRHSFASMNKKSMEKAIEKRNATKKLQAEKRKEQQAYNLENITVERFEDLEPSKDACNFICSDCHNKVYLKNRKAIHLYKKHHQEDRLLICKGCGVSRSKKKANYTRIMNNKESKLYDCTFAEGQEYEGCDFETKRGSRKKYLFKCNNCGKLFEASFGFDDESLVACKDCYNILSTKMSKGEKEIVTYIKSIYSGRIIENDRTVLKPKELDIYLPDINLAIEFNGYYWHREDKSIISKYKECTNKGIRLISIYDFEWENKKELFKKYIASQLGIYDVRLGARECDIREVPTKEAENFIEENHLQGSNRSVTTKDTVCVGLYYKDELVQIETFSNPRYSKNYDWELVRECSKSGYIIYGGKKRLLENFRKRYKGSILSYCDKTFFSGVSYEKCGFTKLKDTPPSYFYFKNGVVYRREKFMKHKLRGLLEVFDSNKTEGENMRNNGYIKLYTLGNFVYEFK